MNHKCQNCGEETEDPVMMKDSESTEWYCVECFFNPKTKFTD